MNKTTNESTVSV